MASSLYIGLLSGTSLDGIDAALFDFGDNDHRLCHAIDYAIPTVLREKLLALCLPGDNEIERMGLAHAELGAVFADATMELLAASATSPKAIRAIGCHGQTIRHRPEANHPFTLQIGDPNRIAAMTGITTVADFRGCDIALGGQGAPLAPAFHQAAFGLPHRIRAIINIGGIANISILDGQQLLGFDTGPGNVLIDAWVNKHQQKTFDRDGQWAGQGSVDQALLAQLKSHPYFAEPPPKSTGREQFNLPWLEQQLERFSVSPVDIQSTLLEFTAQTISDQLAELPRALDEIYVCGGGAFNRQLMTRLKTLNQPVPLTTTATLNIPPDWVEAGLFAWLAKQRINRQPVDLSSITGAKRAGVLGAIYS